MMARYFWHPLAEPPEDDDFLVIQDMQRDRCEIDDEDKEERRCFKGKATARDESQIKTIH